MEYLQCPQCGKKYGVNDQVRAAAGKTTRCRQCGHIFPIVILTRANAKDTSASHPATGEPQKARPQAGQTAQQARKAERRDQPAGRGRPGLQLYLAIGGMTLLALGLGIAWQLNQKSGQPEATPPAGQATATAPANRPKPISSMARASQPEPESATLRSNSETPASEDEPYAPKMTLAEALVASHKPYRSVFKGSDECLELAAAHWNLAYEMTHSKMSDRQMTQMMERSSQSIKAVSASCKNASLAAEINDAARMDEIPPWLHGRVRLPTPTGPNSEGMVPEIGNSAG